MDFKAILKETCITMLGLIVFLLFLVGPLTPLFYAIYIHSTLWTCVGFFVCIFGWIFGINVAKNWD